MVTSLVKVAFSVFQKSFSLAAILEFREDFLLFTSVTFDLRFIKYFSVRLTEKQSAILDSYSPPQELLPYPICKEIGLTFQTKIKAIQEDTHVIKFNKYLPSNFLV